MAVEIFKGLLMFAFFISILYVLIFGIAFIILVIKMVLKETKLKNRQNNISKENKNNESM